MDEATLLTRIQRAFHAAFGTSPSLVTMNATPDAISGWDSLGHAVLANKLEQEFGLSFDIDELMAMEDVKSIVSVLNRKLFFLAVA